MYGKLIKYLGIVLGIILSIYEIVTLGPSGSISYEVFMYGMFGVFIVLSLITFISNRIATVSSLIGLFLTVILQGVLVAPTLGVVLAYTNFYTVLLMMAFAMQILGSLIE